MSTPTQHLTSTDIETMRDQLIMYKTHLEHEENYEVATGGKYRPTDDELERYERFRMWIQAAIKALDNLVHAFDCDSHLMPAPAQIETFTPDDYPDVTAGAEFVAAENEMWAYVREVAEDQAEPTSPPQRAEADEDVF